MLWVLLWWLMLGCIDLLGADRCGPPQKRSQKEDPGAARSLQRTPLPTRTVTVLSLFTFLSALACWSLLALQMRMAVMKVAGG